MFKKSYLLASVLTKFTYIDVMFIYKNTFT